MTDEQIKQHHGKRWWLEVDDTPVYGWWKPGYRAYTKTEIAELLGIDERELVARKYTRE